MNARQHHRPCAARVMHLMAGVSLLLTLGLAGSGDVRAAPGAGAYSIQGAADEGSMIESAGLRGGVRRGGAAFRGGGAVVRRGGGAVIRGGGAVVRRGGGVVVRGGGAVVRGGGVAVVRPWVRRPYFGTVVAGVTLGTIIAATTMPAAPADNVCWSWTNSSHTRGYWDYCR